MPKLDLLSIGAWAPYDHLFKLASYPQNGDTVTLDMPIEELETTYFGDCSANIAVVAAGLGVKTGLAMVVGDDFISTGYHDHLVSHNVDVSAVEVRRGERSGHNYLYFDKNGDGFCVSHQGIASEQSDWLAPIKQIEHANYVVLNEKFSQYTLNSARLAKGAGAVVALNGMVASSGEMAKEFIQLADILFIAQSELVDLLSLLKMDKPEQLIMLGLKTIFATQGKNGSALYTEQGAEFVPSVLVENVLDTTGAGDSYAAGTLAGLINGLPPIQAAQVGATVSSFIIQAWGCQTNLPSWAQMLKRKDQFFKTGTQK